MSVQDRKMRDRIKCLNKYTLKAQYHWLQKNVSYGGILASARGEQKRECPQKTEHK